MWSHIYKFFGDFNLWVWFYTELRPYINRDKGGDEVPGAGQSWCFTDPGGNSLIISLNSHNLFVLLQETMVCGFITDMCEAAVWNLLTLYSESDINMCMSFTSN